MAGERIKTTGSLSVALLAVAALLWGAIFRLDGPLGGRRAAAVWVLGVYALGGVFFAGIIVRLSLLTCPPALWEPGHVRRLVIWKLALPFFCWPLGVLLAMATPLIDALVDGRWPRWLRTSKR